MSHLRLTALACMFLLGAITFGLPTPARAVTVAFLEMRHPEGDVVKLEPGGQFAHVALKLNDGWLHAYPGRGVEIVPSLEGIASYIGHIVYLTRDDAGPPPDAVVQSWLGKPFDPSYRWNVKTSTYCVRLMTDILEAYLLKIEPKPMEFSGELWQRANHYAYTDLGLSPDDLYKELMDHGFYLSPPQSPSCAAPLTFNRMGVKYARARAPISEQEPRHLGLERNPLK